MLSQIFTIITLLSRWKRDSNGEVELHSISRAKILQALVVFEPSDGHECVLPQVRRISPLLKIHNKF